MTTTAPENCASGLKLDKAISREGGVWNAFTFLDWTTYFETMPVDKIDLALRLEADRMVNCNYDPRELESERTVVISEREGDENEPLFQLGEAVQAASFRVHPYQHEIIGDKADLMTMTRADLYGHYRTFYVPNNAVMAVAGDFKIKPMLARIKALYEKIPPGPTPPRLNRAEPATSGERRVTVEGPVTQRSVLDALEAQFHPAPVEPLPRCPDQPQALRPRRDLPVRYRGPDHRREQSARPGP